MLGHLGGSNVPGTHTREGDPSHMNFSFVSGFGLSLM